MKHFLSKILLFLMIAVIAIGILSPKMTEPEEAAYVSGIVQKHNRLDSLSESRRIIFSGGSNLAFGIDSKTIQDTFSLPVVNLALHAGLGLDFVLGELRSVIRKGDVVFLSPEYYAGNGRYELMKAAASHYPPAASYFPTQPYLELKYFFQSRFDNLKMNKDWLIQQLKEKVKEGHIKSTSVYSSDAFNLYGDVISHLEKPGTKMLMNKKKMEYTFWEGIIKINNFVSVAKTKGVSVFFLYPTYARSAYELNKDVISQYQKDLQQHLNLLILNSPVDFVYDDTEFFDTVYHLNKSARTKRTGKLIEIIQKVQVKKPGS